MKHVFGDDELGNATMALFQSSLQPETYKNYGSALNGFREFCDDLSLNPFDATPTDIARYITWLGRRGTVAAGSLQPYLSAINRFLQDHARPPVALGTLVSNVRKGLANCQRDTIPSDIRVPLPAPVVLDIVEKAERLLTAVHWDRSDIRLPLLRVCVATVTAYLFFNRGA